MGLTIIVIVVLLAVAALLFSGATLAGDSTALARVTVQPLGGKIERVQAFGPDGRRVPLAVEGGRLTPLKRLTPGEQVSVDVEVRRPGWLGWALGSERNEHLTLHAPVAQVKEPWMTVPAGLGRTRELRHAGQHGRLWNHRRRDEPHAERPPEHDLARRPARDGDHGDRRRATAVGDRRRSHAGELVPPSNAPVMVSLPAAGTRISPPRTIHLTFSKPVSEVLGSSRPRLSPATPGSWHETNSHTLVFIPSGFGAALGSQLHVQLPRSVAVTAGSGAAYARPARSNGRCRPARPCACSSSSPKPATCRSTGSRRGAAVAHTPGAEAQAAVDPPSGSFSWRYPNTPHQLQAMWTPGQANTITKGAVMKFENENDITVDGLAGPAVWHLLLTDAIAGKRLSSGYSYVYVHREVPETMTLWHDGQTVITSPANTGISGAETELGTFPVFEHLPETTMSGTNPDGSHYEDPGIKWVSYFNGGDALHNFDRSSFGTPQSLGCVELPLAASAEIWPYTPIGTLVTIET